MFKRVLLLWLIALCSNLPLILADPIGGILGGLLGGAGAGGLGGLGGLGGAAGGLGSAGGAAGQAAADATSFFGFATNGLSLLGQGVQVANQIAQSPFFQPMLNQALDAQKLAQRRFYNSNNPLLGAYEPLDPKSRRGGDSDIDDILDQELAEAAGLEAFSGVRKPPTPNPLDLLGPGYRVPKFTLSSHELEKEGTDDKPFTNIGNPDSSLLPLHPDPYRARAKQGVSRRIGATEETEQGSEHVSTKVNVEDPFNLLAHTNVRPNVQNKSSDYYYEDIETIRTTTPNPMDPFNLLGHHMAVRHRPRGKTNTSTSDYESVTRNPADPFNLLGNGANVHPLPLLPSHSMMVPSGIGHPSPLFTGLPGFPQMLPGFPAHTPLSTSTEGTQNPLVNSMGYTQKNPFLTSTAQFNSISNNATESNGVNLNRTNEGEIKNGSAITPSAAAIKRSRIRNRTASRSAAKKSDLNSTPSTATKVSSTSTLPISLKSTVAPQLVKSAATMKPAVDGIADSELIESNAVVKPIVTRAPLRRIFILPRRRLLRLNAVKTRKTVVTRVSDFRVRHK